MNLLNNPLMEKGNRPNFISNEFFLEKETWKKLKKASTIFYKISEKAFEFYKKKDPEIVEIIEFGLPDSIISYLRGTKKRPQKNLLRFDFFISKNGPKLIEVARNPWGLFLFEEYLIKNKKENVLKAKNIYKNIFKGYKKIAIWKGSNIYDDIELMINYFNKKKYIFQEVDNYLDLKKYNPDSLFADLDVLYFTEKIQDIEKYIDKLTPSFSNAILKHKSFLVLLNKIIKDEINISKEISKRDKKFISQFIVDAQLLKETNQEDLFNKGGAVKNVIGMWSRQVHILSPKQKEEHGKSAHKKRQEFRKALRDGINNKNAIWQEYIESIKNNDLIAEISLVCDKKEFYPFIRLYPTKKEVTGGIGITKII